ncbi:MAG: transcription factor S [archaeon]
MMFCPKCKSLLLPKKENNTLVIKCSCGYTKTEKHVPVEISEKIINKNRKIETVERDDSPHPLADAECPKCHHKKAYFWMVQTRASDEPETKFYKCEKCEHIWRDYN